MHLTLNFLGGFHAAVDTKPISESRAKRIEALLIFLAMEAHRPHRRELLIGLLFPDMPDETARTNLRQTLSRLRRAISDAKADVPFLLTSRESTQFNQESSHALDVHQFQVGLIGCAMHRGSRDGMCADCMALLATAVSHYKGLFLDGFFLEDSAAFDEWVLAYRQQFQADALAALDELSQYYNRRGEYDLAAKFARQQLAIEPWREAAQQQLMRALALLGDRNAALMSYDAFCQTLLDELGVDPLPETAALAEQIRDAAAERPYHLPPQSQNLVGRSEELAQLSVQLANPDQRLHTLVGPGGIGKTSLALAIGWQAATVHLGPFLHGVYFVPLADVALVDSAEFNPLVTAVAEAIGFTFAGSRDPQAQLMSYVKNKKMLLLLDNLEHLMAAGRQLILQLHQQAPEVNLLVTSRERLNLAGEWVLPLTGLLTDSANSETSPAMALFVQRAQQVEARFALTEEGDWAETAVAKICQLLEGMPLAIELAAAWVRLLSCPEILAELHQNLDSLGSSNVAQPARHHSLRAVFDYSWQLLTQDEQQTLARLSVFQGGFDRKAAADVAQAKLPQLSALLDKSFLRRRVGANGRSASRYEMLMVVRQFAAEHLPDGAELEALQGGYGRFYLNFVAQQQAALQGQDQIQTLATINQEIENIRLAWRFAVAQRDVQAVDTATATLSLFLYMRSWFREGLALFSHAVEQLVDMAPPAILGKLRARQGWFAFLLGDRSRAERLLQESIEHLSANGEPEAMTYALNYLAVAQYVQGNNEAGWATCQKALAIGKEQALTYSQAISNNILSQIAYLQGRYEVAHSHSQTSLSLEETLGNRWSMGFSLVNLGRVATALGELEKARTHFEESLTIRQVMEDARGQGLCHLYLGDTAVASQNVAEAETHYQKSLAIFRQIGDQVTVDRLEERLANLNQQPAE